MKAVFAGVLLIALSFSSSCSHVKFGNKVQLKDEVYVNKSGKKVFVDEEEDQIEVYEFSADTLTLAARFLQTIPNKELQPTYHLRKGSFDLDLVSIPIKLRQSRSGVPIQLNANLSAAVFVGLRQDFHSIGYKKRPNGKSELQIANFGVSLGMLSGFGNTAINSTTILSRIASEYDGLVWSYGLNGIVAWNQVSIGLAVGKDILLDNNRKYWIYNNQLWYGVTIGLNLN